MLTPQACSFLHFDSVTCASWYKCARVPKIGNRIAHWTCLLFLPLLGEVALLQADGSQEISEVAKQSDDAVAQVRHHGHVHGCLLKGLLFVLPGGVGAPRDISLFKERPTLAAAHCRQHRRTMLVGWKRLNSRKRMWFAHRLTYICRRQTVQT